jgi:hypothetical protein
VCRYCCEPIGQGLLILATVGGWSLWQRGLRAVTVLLVLPVFLALIACYLNAYPYGGYRVDLYAGPALFLLAGEGSAMVLTRLRSLQPISARQVRLVRLANAALVLLLSLPLGRAVHRVLVPWRRADYAAGAEYILQTRRLGDEVAGMNWEYLYYFRRLPPFSTDQQGRVRPHHDRLWLIASAGTPRDRLAQLHNLAPRGWHFVERREFGNTSVVLLVAGME